MELELCNVRIPWTLGEAFPQVLELDPRQHRVFAVPSASQGHPGGTVLGMSAAVRIKMRLHRWPLDLTSLGRWK